MFNTIAWQVIQKLIVSKGLMSSSRRLSLQQVHYGKGLVTTFIPFTFALRTLSHEGVIYTAVHSAVNGSIGRRWNVIFVVVVDTRQDCVATSVAWVAMMALETSKRSPAFTGSDRTNPECSFLESYENELDPDHQLHRD